MRKQTPPKKTNKDKKPLVNWFSRKKEYEYGNVTDSKGNAVINPKTKKPLKKTIKTVTAPDSKVSKGFTKKVVKEEKLDRRPAKRKNINVVIPALAPTALGYAAYNKLYEPNKGGKDVSGRNAAAIGSLVAGAGGTVAMINDARNNNKWLINTDKDRKSKFVEEAAWIGNLALGLPAKYKVGSRYVKDKTKVKNTKEVSKKKNYNDKGGKVTPRFM